MIEFLVTNFYQIAVSILLTSFAGYITWRNGVKARKVIAAAALRDAFSREIAALENPVRTINVREMLISAFDKHHEAVKKYSWYLNPLNKSQFLRVWQQYHSGHNIDAEGWGIAPEDRLFLDYVSIDDESEAAKRALEHIREILRFANQT